MLAILFCFATISPMKKTNIHGKHVIEMELEGGARIVITADQRAQYEARGFTVVEAKAKKKRQKKSKKSSGE